MCVCVGEVRRYTYARVYAHWHKVSHLTSDCAHRILVASRTRVHVVLYAPWNTSRASQSTICRDPCTKIRDRPQFEAGARPLKRADNKPGVCVSAACACVFVLCAWFVHCGARRHILRAANLALLVPPTYTLKWAMNDNDVVMTVVSTPPTERVFKHCIIYIT